MKLIHRKNYLMKIFIIKYFGIITQNPFKWIA
jgi:hypothetical protein